MLLKSVANGLGRLTLNFYLKHNLNNMLEHITLMSNEDRSLKQWSWRNPLQKLQQSNRLYYIDYIFLIVSLGLCVHFNFYFNSIKFIGIFVMHLCHMWYIFVVYLFQYNYNIYVVYLWSNYIIYLWCKCGILEVY